MNNGHLPADLINELGFLLQDYGNELLHHIKVNCSPLPLAAAISSFIYEKEESEFYELQLKLNPSKDIDEIKDYGLREYLVLGYQFYDALFLVLEHKIKRKPCFYWGVLDESPIEYPIFPLQTEACREKRKYYLQKKTKMN